MKPGFAGYTRSELRAATAVSAAMIAGVKDQNEVNRLKGVFVKSNKPVNHLRRRYVAEVRTYRLNNMVGDTEELAKLICPAD